MKSKTFSASNPSALDFPAPPIQNGPSKYAGDGLQQSGNPYGSSDKDNIPLFKSSSSITSGGGAVDFASAVRKLASQDFGIWKYDRNDSADSAVGPSRTSHVLARSYSSGNGRGIYTDRVRNHGSSNAVPAWLETGAAVGNVPHSTKLLAFMHLLFVGQMPSAYIFALILLDGSKYVF